MRFLDKEETHLLWNILVFFLYICDFNLQFMISEKIQFVLYIWGCVSEIQHLNLCDFLN